MHLLIYAYGNPGRQDDGLGIKLIEMLKFWLKKNKIPNIDLYCDYQLNIEDAYNISRYNTVIFIDSTRKRIKNFSFNKLKYNINNISFTTHKITPETILFLNKKLFNSKIIAFLLTIKGYKWNYGIGISNKAKNNLKKAFNYLKKYLKSNFNII